MWIAESVGAQREILLVRARFLRTGLSLQREADEQSSVSTPPFSANSLAQDLNCAVGLARGLVNQGSPGRKESHLSRGKRKEPRSSNDVVQGR